MALTQTQVSQLYVTLFGRSSEGAGNTYWQDQPDMVTAAETILATPAAQDYFGASLDSDEAFIAHIYLNTLGKTAASDPIGSGFWVTELATKSRFEVVANIITAAQLPENAGAAQDQFNNRVAVSNYVADHIQGADLDPTDAAAMQVFIDYNRAVTDDDATVTLVQGTVDEDIAPVVPSANNVLTQMADTIDGGAGDDIFLAPVTQNTTGSGQLANTFETGDVLDGGAGTNVLRADLIETGSIQDVQASPAIAATTSNIQEVYFTAQSQQVDSGANNTTQGSTIDAGRMSDVEQWWTDESRSTVPIEDIRSRPQDTTFGMKLTDALVGYNAFFNPLFLDGDMTAESALTLIVQEITDGQAPSATELENISVREINFTLGDTDYTLSTADIQAADTWADLETAVAAELTEQGLDTLSVSHNGNGVFEINDTAGGTFAAEDGVALILGVASDIDTRNRVDVGRLEQEGQVSTTLILDGAGSGSRGGVVNIAAMSGDRGVEVMEVLVGRNSHISTLQSVNDPSNTYSFSNEQMLEEVYVSHVDGAEGTLQIGYRTVDPQGVSTTTDDRLQTNGLQDVRVFDASGFGSELKVGASLTNAAFDKYLVGADDTVQFSYLLGDAGSNLNLAVNNLLAGDVDFALEVVGGAGDDRINLTGLAVKQQTSVDGGLGENTLEVNTSTGFAATLNGADIGVAAATDLTAAETSFASVENIDNVVIAGAVNTTHDVTAAGFGDVDSFVIATTGGVNTRLINLDVTDQTVDVSGKNQTLGTGNSDANQAFGTIRFSNTTGSELDLTLDNTARVTGTLTVAALTIDGNTSGVRTLNLDSAGTRQTSNVVTILNGNRVNTFNLEGSQDLTITNLASAANSTAAAASRDSLLVDGSGLGTFDAVTGDLVEAADLYLGVTGAVVTAVDAALGTNRTVELIGTDGESDILNIRDGVVTTNATTISEFETIRFGENAQIVTATNFNATNVSDVDLYDLVDSNVAINLNSLRSTENVQINAATLNAAGVAVATSVAADVTLAAANPTTGSQVNVNFASDATTALHAPTYWAAGGANLNVQDFSTISLDMGGTALQSYDYNFNLNTLANPTSGNVNARTLEITGGQFDASFANLDSLTLNQLDTALTKVDFSDYSGNFITNGWNSTLGSNADVVANQFGMIFDIGGDNTLFNVGIGLGANAGEQQTIDFDNTVGLNNDFGDLINGESITITFAGGQYTFTNDTGAPILEANIADAIFADAANAPSQFTITQTGGAGTPIEVNASSFGDMPAAVITASDLINNTPANVVVVDDVVQGGLATGVPTSFVTVETEFLTKFIFTEDAADQGIVWQIDNFQPFDSVGNVSLNTQTQLDLRQLDVDSSTKITIEDGATFLANVNADAALIAEYSNALGVDNYTAFAFDGITQIQELTANDTVITSNDDLDFTIILTGVDTANLGNENIVGIA